MAVTCGSCPEVTPPKWPAFCEGGTIKYVEDAQGLCVVGFQCVRCPPVSRFPDCPSGTIAAAYDETGVCISAFECVVCHDLPAPPVELCPAGELVPVYDAYGICIAALSCQP